MCHRHVHSRRRRGMTTEGAIRSSTRTRTVWSAVFLVGASIVLAGPSPVSAAPDSDAPAPEGDELIPDPEPTEDVDETLLETVRVEDLIASWWSGPRAVHHRESGVTLSTGVSSDGTFTLSRHDLRSGAVERITLGRAEPDDHNTPAVTVGPDLPTMVFYSRHGKDRLLRYRTADEPWSISFGPERTVELPGRVTYVQALRGPYLHSVRVLSRVSGSWWLTASNDGGRSWSSQRVFQFPASQSGYVVLRQRSDGSVRFAAAGHPVSSDLRAIWAGTIELDGSIRDQAGGVIASLATGQGLPLDVTVAMAPIHTVPPGHSLRLFDVSPRDGAIDVALADWSLDDHVATYRLVSSSGARTELGGAGEVIGFNLRAHYHGGVAFGDREDAVELILAREHDGMWTVEQWVEGTAGVAWAETLAADPLPLLRPITVLGAGGDINLWHQASHYGDVYTDYRADKIIALGGQSRPHVGAFVPALAAPAPATTQPAPSLAVTGDWNGDGRTTPGTFMDGIWRLQMDTDGPVAEFLYGRPGDVPVTGDWNRDGRTTVGVVRGNEWLLRNANSRGPVSVSFLYGRPGDVPVTGDWNRDGRTTVGVVRGNEWLLRNSNSRGPVSTKWLPS
jgi:hypothetical protein